MVLAVLFFNTTFALFLSKAEAVFELVFKVEQDSINADTILLGDSVCLQFYSERKDDEVYCLCDNQSYETPGNYILLDLLVHGESKFKELILMINPETLVHSLNQDFTYNYFVKPFRAHIDLLDKKEIDYIKATFPDRDILKYKFSNFQFPDSLKLSENNHLDSLKISELNLRYIAKIDSLCKKNNIVFKMVCPPLPSSNRELVDRFSKENRTTFPSYFKSISYYDSAASKDGMHHDDAKGFVKTNKKQLDGLLEK